MQCVLSYYLRQGGNAVADVCLCLFMKSTTQNVLKQFPWNLFWIIFKFWG